MRPLLPPAASVAVAGAATMAVEMLLPRRLAPELGSALPVWTADFAVALAGLAIGSALGGRRVDRPGVEKREGWTLLLAAFAVAAAPFLARAAARALPHASLVERSLASMAAGGLLPTLLLGAVYPAAAARSLGRSKHRGRALGRLSAAGAVGSLLGTFGAAYGLIPRFEVPVAFFLVAGALAVTALARFGHDRSTTGRRHQEAALAAAASPTPSVPLERPRLVPPPLTNASRAWSGRGALPLAAIVGLATLALEIVVARRVAVDAGSSLEAWTSVVGVVLLGLSLGGTIGGLLAERGGRGTVATLLGIAALLAIASLWTAGIVRAVRVDPSWTASAAWGVESLRYFGISPFAARTAVGVLYAYGPLFIVLGAIPPVLARAVVVDAPDAGRRAARVYAVGTVGALAGSLGTGPWAIPALRLEGAVAAAALLLALAAFAAARRRATSPVDEVVVGLRLLAPAAVAAAAAGLLFVARADTESARKLGLRLHVRPDAEGVWVSDSPYARVVIDAAPEESQWWARDLVRMRIDARTHGIQDRKDPSWIGSNYGTLYAAAAERLMGKRDTVSAVFLGGGTYTAPRAILARWPSANVDVAEIDPEVTRAAKERLALGEPAGLTIAHMDGRAYLRAVRGRKLYDLVFADAMGDVAVPWHLTTKEYLDDVRAVMAPGGAYLANTIDTLRPGLFVGAVRATLRASFRHVEVIGVWRNDEGLANFVFVASDEPIDMTGLLAHNRLDAAGPREPILRYEPAELDEVERRNTSKPLTDDFAPVEALLAPAVEKAAPK